MRLGIKTKPEWVLVVMGDFDSFLVDHALCERKASALAMSLVAHYPNHSALVSAMVDLAIEELSHKHRKFLQLIHEIHCDRVLGRIS